MELESFSMKYSYTSAEKKLNEQKFLYHFKNVGNVTIPIRQDLSHLRILEIINKSGQ